MPLIPCGHCGCHVHSFETSCPHCGEALLKRDGSRVLSVAALVAGLSVVGVAGACSSDTETSDDASSSSDASSSDISSSVIAAYGGSPSVGGFGSTGNSGGAGGNNGGAGGVGGNG